MKIAVVGTGYVGLVTGVALSEIEHSVTCIDTDVSKVKLMQEGYSPIYEPGLEDLMIKNINKGNLRFTTNHYEGFNDADVIIIAVGTPQLSDGSADLQYIKAVARSIGENILSDTVVVTKSTVPVGTNKIVKDTIFNHLKNDVNVSIASNPEFLREGSAIYDTFNGDRIILGAEDYQTIDLLEKMYQPLNIPVYKTDIQSAEMIKYASNAFLATKISFINEISNICEKLDANIEDVADGMGFDNRIGRAFLNAGIGYGGSCFPKDTQALVQIAGGVDHDFKLLKSVIEVNNNQQLMLIDKLKKRLGQLKDKKIALLGLAFKPNTDDVRESPAIVIANELSKYEANVVAYDPIATENARNMIDKRVMYTDNSREALKDADAAIIVTDWDEFKNLDLFEMPNIMKQPVIFDGRNCFNLNTAVESGIEYYSVGRPQVNKNILLNTL